MGGVGRGPGRALRSAADAGLGTWMPQARFRQSMLPGGPCCRLKTGRAPCPAHLVVRRLCLGDGCQPVHHPSHAAPRRQPAVLAQHPADDLAGRKVGFGVGRGADELRRCSQEEHGVLKALLTVSVANPILCQTNSGFPRHCLPCMIGKRRGRPAGSGRSPGRHPPSPFHALPLLPPRAPQGGAHLE